MPTSTSADPAGPFRARWFDGDAPVGRDAEVRVTAAGLHVSAEGRDARWPIEQIVQTRGERRGEPVQLERRDATEVLVSDDAALIAALRAHHPAAARSLRGPSARPFTGRLLALLLAAAAIAWVAFAWGVPALAVGMARAVPVEWEERMGAAMLDQFERGAKVDADPRLTTAIDTLLAALGADRADDPYTYRVVVIDAAEINAFAAPGGAIGIYRGLLAFVRTPDELAAVLAHEMEHVRRRHVTIALAQRLSLSALVALLGGDGSFVLDAARTLGELSYGRDAEYAADDGGLTALEDSGGDPHAMPALLERMERASGRTGALEFLSTHPAGRARAERLRAKLGDGTRPPRPLLSEATWRALREAVPADTSGRAR